MNSNLKFLSVATFGAFLAACGNSEDGVTGATASPLSANAATPSADGESLLLSPTVTDGPEAFLVIFPGANLPPEAYVDLAQAIQAATPLKLWVGVARFTFDTPEPLEAGGRVEHLLQRAAADGFSGGKSQVILAGHSLGGIFAKDTARSEGLGALVLLGSYLPKLPGSPNLTAYPLPVLTLGGELDGRTWITRLAEEAGEEQTIAQQGSELDAARTKPVVILPSVTHFQFADGRADSEDLTPEIPLADAHQRIAAALSSFLVTRASGPGSAADAAAQALLGDVQSTRLLLAAYATATSFDDGAWCVTAQEQIGGVTRGESGVAIDDVAYGDDVTFALSKPSVAGAVDRIETESLVSYALDPLDTGTTIPNASTSIACKMKRPLAIAAAMGVSVPPTEPTCEDVNEAALAWALAHVPAESSARYASRGHQLQLTADAMQSTGVGWLAAGLGFNADATGLVTVQSEALVTAPDALLGLGGMHYCKLLTPARAVEWIQVASLKK